MTRIALLLLPLLLAGPARAQFPGETWERLGEAEAERAGWSREKLAAARDYAATVDTEAVMVVVGGKVLDSWGPLDRKFNSHSIRKSLIGALCGIQVEAGKIDLDATMGELGIDDNAPSLSELEKTATVRHLLQSRSGIYHPALYETERMKAARPARHSHAPGAFWYYNNWDFNALGTLYEQAAKSRIHEDFQRLVGDPIGMEDYESSDGEYVGGDDSIHPAYPFRISARDLARFGLLFLRGGQWRGEQVVPASWVEESLVPWSSAGDRGGYGYLWWVERGGMHFPGVVLPEGSYSARGAGGHYLLVVPVWDLVVVHRVDTDVPGRRVEAAEFGELVRRILEAFEPPASDGATAAETTGALLPLLMARHGVPGVAVVGLEDWRIAWERYAGVREAGGDAPVDADTVFEAASMTKPLAACAALRLAEQGALDLDRPLASYLPEPYLEDEPRHEAITARMVLNHTGGFPNWRPKGEALRVLHEPGSAFRYSGEGFLFLQRVIEEVTGEDYESHVQRTLLRPLGMRQSSHVWQERFAGTAAAGHGDGGRVKAGRRLYAEPNAAYTLYCTPRDYAAFVLGLMHPERGGPLGLGAASLEAMFAPSSPPTGGDLIERRGSRGSGEVRYGLGWSIEPTASGDRIRHSGSNGTGFRSHVEFDPQKGHGLLVMTNGVRGDRLWRDLVGRVGVP